MNEKDNSKKNSNPRSLGCKGILTTTLVFFPLKVILKFLFKPFPIVQVQQKKSNNFFLVGHCTILYYNCVKPGATFNSLHIFNVCLVNEKIVPIYLLLVFIHY